MNVSELWDTIASQETCSALDTLTEKSTLARVIPEVLSSVKSGTYPDKTFGIYGVLSHGEEVAARPVNMVYMLEWKVWDHGLPVQSTVTENNYFPAASQLR